MFNLLAMHYFQVVASAIHEKEGCNDYWELEWLVTLNLLLTQIIVSVDEPGISQEVRKKYIRLEEAIKDAVLLFEKNSSPNVLKLYKEWNEMYTHSS